MRDRLVVYMLHRFCEREGAHGRIGPAFLRQALEFLRRNHIEIHSLRHATDCVRSDEPLSGVVLTIDDGYADFAEIAAPILREYDCPATVFLATGFLDGLYWFWWDKLEWAIGATTAVEIVVPSGARIPLGTRERRTAASRLLVNWLKLLPDALRWRIVDAILAQSGVEMPSAPPVSYRPASWDTVRSLAGNGLDFAPHTVSHASLAQTATECVRQEVRQSLSCLRARGVDPVPVLAYPYGLAHDVSRRVVEIVEAEGLWAAFSALPGYVYRAARQDQYMLPRFAFPCTMLELRQVVFGFEVLKAKLRAPIGKRAVVGLASG